MDRRNFMKVAGAAPALPWALSAAAIESPLSDLRAEAGRMVDDLGRTVLLRGVNLSNANKRPDETGSFIPDWIERSVFEDLAGRGFNCIRLVMVWEALEPEPGKYSQPYIEKLGRIVRLAREYGIYTVMDMHQDLFTRHIAGGDGAPKWAIGDLGPTRRLDPWFLNYFQPKVAKAFDRFWQNKDKIQDYYQGAWAELARNFRDEPGVAGYELMNEPHPGSMLYLPDRFDREYLAPFIRGLIKKIRQEDPARSIFFEGSMARSFFWPPRGYPSALPDDLGENLVFAPHFYDKRVTITQSWDGKSERIENKFDKLVKEAERMGAAIWIGEWWVEANPAENGEDYLESQLRAFDKITAGWAYWQYNAEDTNDHFASGSKNAWVGKELDRPYPRRSAGKIESISFDPDNGRFELKLRGLPGVGGPTEIYLPDRIYGRDFTVDVSNGSESRFAPDTRTLAVEAPPANVIQSINIEY